MTLLLATHDLHLWLLRDAVYEQQFLGFRVSYFFAKVKNFFKIINGMELLVCFNGQQKLQNQGLSHDTFIGNT